MINEEIAKHGTGTTDQSCFYFIGERLLIGGSPGCPNKAIWGLQSAGISLRSGGQKESGSRSDSRTVCRLYGKTRPQPDQTHKSYCVINGVVDQHSSKNGTGGVFIKTSAWRKKREALNSPGLMTGLVSKSSPRLTVSLFLIQHLTIS